MKNIKTIYKYIYQKKCKVIIKQYLRSNSNLFKSINKFKIENPNANFKDWIPEYITNTSELNLTRKGVQRRNRIVNYGSNHPLINRCNHLLTDNELRVNQELYKRLIELTKNSLKPYMSTKI